MPIILKNLSVVIGLLLILFACAMIFFPPKFGSIFYGVRTKWTMKSKTLWVTGQRLFAYSILTIGLVISIIGFLHIDELIKPFPMVLIVIGLSTTAKYFVHKALENKFATA